MSSGQLATCTATGIAGMSMTSGKTTSACHDPLHRTEDQLLDRHQFDRERAPAPGPRSPGVTPSSMDSGSATAEMPWKTMPTATSPGTTMVA